MTKTSADDGVIDFEAIEDQSSNPTDNPTIAAIVATRLSRRQALAGGLAALAASQSGLIDGVTRAAAQSTAVNTTPSFAFKEVAALVDEKHFVAEGHDANVLIRWGDGVAADAPAFDPMRQTAASQGKQFGYNNDFLGYFPMPGAANPSYHGVLVVNHEYCSTELMLPGLTRGKNRKVNPDDMTAERNSVEMMAHGGSVVEVKRGGDGKWSVVAGSKFGRRITAETPMEISGPAAGDDRMKTSGDPQGRRVLGMINNCAGGVTPWGTWVTCEENINNYFMGSVAETHPEFKNHKRMGIPGGRYQWGREHDRFQVTKEPNESNRFGWIVEIDPFDTQSTPKKRTALGRFKHEGAAGIINRDGRYVIYSGDDQRFDYVYRFVTDARVDMANLRANRDILDKGTLSVARFDADGTMRWMPLVFGVGPLTVANGFRSQADVVIDARRAGDLLGATKMDRPEDIEANPKTGKVYVLLTKNEQRKAGDENPANPWADNRGGHIVEMTPTGGDHAADAFQWEILVRCGDPAKATVGKTFNPATSKDGWFANPDNLAFDAGGRLWISTDGNSDTATGRNDGLWALETEGAARGTAKLFFRCPVGAEMCGPCFTPDGETLFVAIQHPAEDGDEWRAFNRFSSFEDPSTRWPDFKPDMPPRPSVMAVTRRGGGRIA